MNIENLINGATQSLLNTGHLKLSSVKHNYQAGFKFIARFYKDLGCNVVDDLFFIHCYGHMNTFLDTERLSKERFKRYTKCIAVLRQYNILGTTHYECLRGLSFKYPLEQNDIILQNFLDAERLRLSESTIRSKKNIVKQFFNYLENDNAKDLSRLTPKSISSFLEHMSIRRAAGLGAVVATMRSYISFLHKAGVTQEDLSLSISIRVIRKHKIHGVFTAEEVERIIAQIDKTTLVGKRDLAIILLSSRNGLRGVDILNLRILR
jgi:integrase